MAAGRRPGSRGSTCRLVEGVHDGDVHEGVHVDVDALFIRSSPQRSRRRPSIRESGAANLVDDDDDARGGGLRALRSTKRAPREWASEASTMRTTPSTMAKLRFNLLPKSAWPGVSITLMVTPS